MNDQYTIGELAKAAEVPSSTVRYYERARLLEPQGRTGGNYRYYTQESVHRLRFIRAAQAGGVHYRGRSSTTGTARVPKSLQRGPGAH